MITRRNVLPGIGAGVMFVPTLMTCTSSVSEQEAARALRSPLTTGTSDRPQLMPELMRYATLASSTHNTQCWRFKKFEKSIRSRPMYHGVALPATRTTITCLCQWAALPKMWLRPLWRMGSRPTRDSTQPEQGASQATLTLPSGQMRRLLFQAITDRQCARGDYDGQPISPTELRLLEKAGTGNGVGVQLLTAHPMMERAVDYVVEGNVSQMNDSALLTNPSYRFALVRTKRCAAATDASQVHRVSP